MASSTVETCQVWYYRGRRHGWGYWLRLLAFFGVTMSLAAASLPLLVGIMTTLGLLYGPCGRGGSTPGDYGLAWEEVRLEARAGGSFRGVFIPGPNGATIIMPPAFTSGPGGRLAEAAMLVEHGYTVFKFESRRCAEMGPLSLGYQEVAEVGDAIDYLLTRPEVDPERIGVYGFSSAGATAIMAAARFPILRAVVAEGGYGDFINNTLGGQAQDGLTAYFIGGFRTGMRLTYWVVTGNSIDVLSPRQVIGQIEPRPVLLIYGSRESSLAGGRQQLAAAGESTRLWVVPGAGHGTYLQTASEAYEQQVVGFFDKALGVGIRD